MKMIKASALLVPLSLASCKGPDWKAPSLPVEDWPTLVSETDELREATLTTSRDRIVPESERTTALTGDEPHDIQRLDFYFVPAEERSLSEDLYERRADASLEAARSFILEKQSRGETVATLRILADLAKFFRQP